MIDTDDLHLTVMIIFKGFVVLFIVLLGHMLVNNRDFNQHERLVLL